MGFFANVISGFKDAAKAGSEFNPVFEALMAKLEELHAQGHLDDVVYKAEQAYKEEHAAYAAKGIHTDAADSQNDVKAMKHFLDTLKQSIDHLDPAVKDEAAKVLELRDKMENILGNILHK